VSVIRRAAWSGHMEPARTPRQTATQRKAARGAVHLRRKVKRHALLLLASLGLLPSPTPLRLSADAERHVRRAGAASGTGHLPPRLDEAQQTRRCSARFDARAPYRRGGGRVFLPFAGFIPPGSGNGRNRLYRSIPLNTARIQISNQNR
jgi:hypothetical protein